MKRLTYNTQEEWHELRHRHIGGSDIASLFNAWRFGDGSLTYRHLFAEPPKGAVFAGCVSPYMTGVRLWHERKGNIPQAAFNSARTEAGTHLEPAIAAWAKERTGWNIQKVTDYLVDDAIDGMGASLDYEILDHPEGHAAMDCKETAPWVFKDDWRDGVTPEPPLHIVLQLQHQMAVAEMEHGVVACYESGVDLHLIDVPRNQPIIKMIGEAVESFWWHIKHGKAPDVALDFSVTRDLYRNADPQIQLDMSDDEEFNRLVDTWDFARMQARRWSEAKDAAHDQILATVQDATEICLPMGRVLSAPTLQRRSKEDPSKVQMFRRLSLTSNDKG